MPIAHKAYGLYKTVFDKWAHDVAGRIKNRPMKPLNVRSGFLDGIADWVLLTGFEITESD